MQPPPLVPHIAYSLPASPPPHPPFLSSTQLHQLQGKRGKHIQEPSLLLAIKIYDPVPTNVIATNGHTLNGFCPGLGFGPDSPDAKRRPAGLRKKVRGGVGERRAEEAPRRCVKRRHMGRDMMAMVREVGTVWVFVEGGEVGMRGRR